MHRLLYLIIFFLAFVYLADLPLYDSKGMVLGYSTSGGASAPDTIPFKIEYVTTTSFDQKEDIETFPISYTTRYEKDPEMEYGKEEVIQEGEDGIKTLNYLVTYWLDEELDRTLISTEIEEPVEEVISKGTKIVWKMLEGTEVGGLKYWYKLKVWATKYDGNCLGCTGRTFSGTLVKKGVCAVDPSVIPLGTNFYVAGYGLCRAEDIGGGVKGAHVDLGYEVVSLGEWRTGWTEVYLLTNAPE